MNNTHTVLVQSNRELYTQLVPYQLAFLRDLCELPDLQRSSPCSCPYTQIQHIHTRTRLSLISTAVPPQPLGSLLCSRSSHQQALSRQECFLADAIFRFLTVVSLGILLCGSAAAKGNWGKKKHPRVGSVTQSTRLT